MNERRVQCEFFMPIVRNSDKKPHQPIAWDLLVNVLKLDPERMWFTVFGGDEEVPADEEAAALWVEVGARPERILRFIAGAHLVPLTAEELRQRLAHDPVFIQDQQPGFVKRIGLKHAV